VRGTPSPLGPDGGWSSGYIFDIANNGTFSVWKAVSGIITPLQEWTSSPEIQGGGWNTLRVVFSGSNLTFYINGVSVWSGSDNTLTSGYAGIEMWNDANAGNGLWVDWATLTVGVP
jgi:hypothetical protein